MEEQMRTMVETGTLNEETYRKLVDKLAEVKATLTEEQLFTVTYRNNIVSAMSINFTDDDDTRGVHMFEDHYVRMMIVTSKEYRDNDNDHDSYSKVFNAKEIAVHNGVPIMKPGSTWSAHNRTEDGNYLLFQNTIISVTPFTRKRTRE